MIDEERKDPMYPKDQFNYGKLNISNLDLVIDVADIDQYPNEQYALLRKRGLGTSDSSILLGVNPYTTYTELVEEKCRNFLTAEEKEVGNKTAVRKGRDLEPLIINKFSAIINKPIIKPSDMYAHKDFPWLKFNFDGVIDLGNGKYIPAEIKVVTAYGIKHYDPTKAWYRESLGIINPEPVDHSKENNSIATKAAEYGIPPYYYTQLQQQIYGLNAEFGYLTVMFDSTWEVVSFLIPRDETCITGLLAQGMKAWTTICNMTRDPNRSDTSELVKEFNNAKEVQPTDSK